MHRSLLTADADIPLAVVQSFISEQPLNSCFWLLSGSQKKSVFCYVAREAFLDEISGLFFVMLYHETQNR